MEVMGLMLGEFVDDYTVKVVDVFAMPQSGTGVSVEAVDPVFQTKMLDMLKQCGRYAAVPTAASHSITLICHFAPAQQRLAVAISSVRRHSQLAADSGHAGCRCLLSRRLPLVIRTLSVLRVTLASQHQDML